MPFKKYGGPGFMLETDELAWKAYRFKQDTGRNPTREELLNWDDAIDHDVKMCEWFVRYAQDKDIDPFTHEGKE